MKSLQAQPPEAAATGCNENETSACDDVTETEVWRTLMAVYLGAILFVSVSINGTLCLVFYKKQHLLNISNCFVLNLACCHLVLSIVVIPFTFFAAVSRDTVYSGAWCDIQAFFFTAIIVTIQLALLVISLDRNYAIMNSLRYPTVFTSKLCTIMIVCSWVLGVVISFPPLLNSGLGKYTFHRYQFICTLDWSGQSPYLVVFNAFAFMLPIVIQGFCYLKIFKAALGHTKRSMRVHPWVTSSSVKQVRDTTSDSSESGESICSDDTNRGATQYKAVRTIFLIALSYCVCWVPYMTEAYLVYTRGVLYPNLSAASVCLVFSTGVLNPIIYAYMNRVTRREIGRFLCGTGLLNDNDDFVSTSMSTYSTVKAGGTWAAQQRLRSRSAGGLNEMDTILEEAEESQICETRSVVNMHIGETTTRTNHFTQTSPPGATKKQREILNVFQLSDQVKTQQANKLSTSVIQTGALGTPSTSYSTGKGKSSSRSRQKRSSDSAWNVIHSDKFIEEKRRTFKTSLDGSYHRERRRKAKDYGSFLSFEEEEVERNKRKTNNERKLRKCRSQRLSVDQKVSVTNIPKLLKFRFSVSDIDNTVQKVTVRSNVEIENKPSTSSMIPEHESSSTLPHEVYRSSKQDCEKGKSKHANTTVLSVQEEHSLPVVSYPVSPGHVTAGVFDPARASFDSSSDGMTDIDYDDVFSASNSIATRRSV